MEIVMSKAEKSSKESGAHVFAGGKNHDKPAKYCGAHDSGKHEQPLKSDGAHANAKKPLVQVEDVNTHNGRPHPSASRLADSKLLGGKLRKADNV
jgi:hypothetical protein